MKKQEMDNKLERLYSACERVMNLIRQKQTGLISWHLALMYTCQDLKAIIDQEDDTPPVGGDKNDD